MKKVHGRGGSDTESFKSEGSMQRKKRLASEETMEDFEGEEQDQENRSCLSFSDRSSQVNLAQSRATAFKKMKTWLGLQHACVSCL